MPSTITPEHTARATKNSAAARASRLRMKRLERLERAAKAPPRPPKPRVTRPNPRKGQPLNGPKPFVAAELALWTGVIEQVLQDIETGLAAMRDPARTGSDRRSQALHHGSLAARWFLDQRRSRDLILETLGINPAWYCALVERHFGRGELEALAGWTSPSGKPAGRRRRDA
jgi:hypothetical protein